MVKRIAHAPDVFGIQGYDYVKNEWYPMPLSHPTDGYMPSDIDESGDPRYYGFLGTEGSWYIMQYNEGAGTVRYFKGTSAYTTNWTGRALLEYGYFDAVF